jgi:DNA polymerase-3 subunit delta'
VRLAGLEGQPRARAQLEAELAAGRLAHAYLFVGPAGTGRGTAARALMAAVNCQQREAAQPCGACGPCRRLAAGSHEDFLELAPPAGAASAQIKAEEVREAIRTISFPPFAGGTRVVLIRRAGNLNPTSANVLLKTLEEPPPGNILVLTVQDAREVLPTLASRSRRVRFAPLAAETIAAELEARGTEPRAARLKAALAGGSLGRALELDQQRLAGELERLTGRLAEGGGPAGDWAFAEELVSQHRGQYIDREGLAEALELLAVHFRDRAVAAAGRPGAALLPFGGGELTVAAAAEAFGLVRRAQGQILGNAAPELAVTVLLGRLRELVSDFAPS